MHPGDLSAGARLDRVKYVGKAGVAARVEYDVGEGSLHAGLVGVLFRAMITRAVERGMVLGIEIADLPALLARIMDALRWKSAKMPLLYDRNLAAEAGAAGGCRRGWSKYRPLVWGDGTWR